MTPEKVSGFIKASALEAGLDLCRIALPRPLVRNGEVLAGWCSDGMNAGMAYMARRTEVRENPALLFPGTKSVVVAAINYYSLYEPAAGVPVIARYAHGKDYHTVIKEKLGTVLGRLKEAIPGADGMICVDSSPIMEKPWGALAGIGWQGKNSILISREFGSWILLGLLLITEEAAPDEPFSTDPCASCTKCIDSCPTAAINTNRTVDARRCISNLTIENRGDIPPDILPKLNGRIYGCDICQEVCPFNRAAVPHSHPEFLPPEEFKSMNESDWRVLSEDTFARLFGQSPVSRVGFARFRKNLDAWYSSQENSAGESSR